MGIIISTSFRLRSSVFDYYFWLDPGFLLVLMPHTIIYLKRAEQTVGFYSLVPLLIEHQLVNLQGDLVGLSLCLHLSNLSK